MKAEVRNPKSEVAPVSRAASAALLLSWLLCAVVAGCAVGPDYKRPAVNAPAAYRTAESDTNTPAGPESFADLGWWRRLR